MLTSLFVTLAGLATAAGGVGVAALFVPSVGLLMKSALDFLRSPLGIAIGGIAGAFLIYSLGWIGGDIHGTRSTRAEWRSARTAAAEAKRQSEEAAQRIMRADVDARSVALDRYNETVDLKVKQHASDNPKTCPCRRATGDDIKRLLSIH